MIRTIISDLGNVLLRFDHKKACRALAERCNFTADEIYERLFNSKLVMAFDLGRITPAEFSRSVHRVFDLEPDSVNIRRIWEDIFWPADEMEDLIRGLKGRYSLALLSNTNEWHFDYCFNTYPFLSCFDAYILSFKVGCRKPDPAIYREALSMTGTSPEECLYIDDIRDYIKGAEEMGMKGICFENARQLRSEMAALGIQTP